MRKNFLFGLLAIGLASFGFGGISLANEAKIGGTEYSTLVEAIAAVPSDGTETTVNLLGDVALVSTLTIDGNYNIILDLGGNKLTGPSGATKAIVLKQGSLNVTNGTIESPSDQAINVCTRDAGGESNYTNLVISSTATVKGAYAVILRQADYSLCGGTTKNGYGANIQMDGTLNGNLWIIGNIYTGDSTVRINGTINSTDNGLAQQGYVTVVIGETANITAVRSAIELRAGNLTINGGNFTATAESFEIAPNGDGASATGVALAVSQHTTNLPISLTINGGTFNGQKSLYEKDVQDDTVDVEMSVKGGIFSGDVYSENVAKFIEGGNFVEIDDDTKEISLYVVDGKSANVVDANGDVVYTIEPTDPSAPGIPVVNYLIKTEAENGTITSTPAEKAASGTIITLTATPNANYEFRGWSVKKANGDDVTVTNNTFEMPASNVTVTATFTYIPRSKTSGGSSSSSSAKTDDSKATTGDTAKTDDDSKATTGDTAKTDDDTKADDSKGSEGGNDGASASESTFSQEFKDAYEFAFKNGITTQKSIEEADMYGALTRIAMAKMLSQYAINVLGKTPDTSKVVPTFSDVDAQLDADYNNGVTLAYQLGIMGIGIQDFRPFDTVTRAEFGTALSRMLYGLADGEGNEYYSTHLAKLMSEKIITNDTPDLKELRGYVMIMLMRSAQK